MYLSNTTSGMLFCRSLRTLITPHAHAFLSPFTIDTLCPYMTTTPKILSPADSPRRFKECHKISRFQALQAQAAAKLRYDDAHTNVSYSGGDVVWLWDPIRKSGVAEKLIFKYVGPYRILRHLTTMVMSVSPQNIVSAFRQNRPTCLG